MQEYASLRCRQFLHDYADRAKEFRQTSKVVRGLAIPDGEDIYLIHDDTLFKSGKDGFAITEKGIYVRAMNEQPAPCLTWNAFAKLPAPKVDGSYVVCKARRVAYYTGDDSFKEEICDLFRRLHHKAKSCL